MLHNDIQKYYKYTNINNTESNAKENNDNRKNPTLDSLKHSDFSMEILYIQLYLEQENLFGV